MSDILTWRVQVYGNVCELHLSLSSLSPYPSNYLFFIRQKIDIDVCFFFANVPSLLTKCNRKIIKVGKDYV